MNNVDALLVGPRSVVEHSRERVMQLLDAGARMRMERTRQTLAQNRAKVQSPKRYSRQTRRFLRDVLCRRLKGRGGKWCIREIFTSDQEHGIVNGKAPVVTFWVVDNELA